MSLGSLNNSFTMENNVTHRKNNQTKMSTTNSNTTITSLISEMDESSENDFCSGDSFDSPNLTRSCPDLTMRSVYNDTVASLQSELIELKQKYASAENEIENLLLENGKLKKHILECETKIEKLTIICSSTNLTPIQKSSRKNKRTCKKIKKRQSQAELDVSQTECLQTQRAPTQSDEQQPENALPHEKPLKKDKIYILSSNKSNRVLNTYEEIFEAQKFRICHFLKPNCGIKTLLADADIIAADLTENDYFVFQIGDEDFNTTNEYFSLIYCIREKFQNIMHTNTIICLPTFRYGPYQNMFNWRVENFNNLLYLDISTHKYSHLLDSNLNLTYDSSMFYTRTGVINNRGTRVIIKDLYNLMFYMKVHVHSENLDTNTNMNIDTYPQSSGSQLFRS